MSNPKPRGRAGAGRYDLVPCDNELGAGVLRIKEDGATGRLRRLRGIALAALLAWSIPTFALGGPVQRPADPYPRPGMPRVEPSPRPTTAIEFYVAADGDDRWSGTLPSPSTDHRDGPFATLERARDAVRELNQSPRSDPGVVVYLRGGTYLRTQAFRLDAQDGATAERPVVYRASPNENVRLIGGRPVNGFTPVTDAAILDRLDPPARGKVMQTDLREAGITDFGDFSPRGFHRPVQAAPLEVFFRGTALPVAHWPKVGFANITDVPAGPDGGKFTFDNPRLARWAKADDLWVHGYWTWDWADSYEKVKTIDLARHHIVTEPPHGIYGYARGKRFQAMNVLEELDQPGEWYVDRKTGMLYLWPPEPEVRAGDVIVSTLADPMVEVRNASHVTLRGLSFECSRGCGAVIVGGSHNRIEGCAFTNLGTFAVSVGDHYQHLTDDLYKNPTLNRNAGVDNGVVACDISHTGEGGILLGGGDRKALTPAGNFVINNRITDFARWVRSYRPAVFVDGVGNHVAHNAISDAPHVGILLKGNDHVVEYNEVARVCMETADVGAFYMGRDFTERGNVVRFNLFRDCGAPPSATAPSVETRTGAVEAHPAVDAGAAKEAGLAGAAIGYSADVNAIYLDDCASGTLVYGNIVYRCGRGILLGGGRDNSIDNNLLIDCSPALFVDARGLGWMKNFFDGTEPVLFDRLKLVRAEQPPYGRRYPELARIMAEEPAAPRGNRIVHNVRLGGTWLEAAENLPDEALVIRDNFSDGNPQLTAPDRGDFRPRPDSPVWKLGFHPIPIDRIGLQRDEFRQQIAGERN